MDNAAVATRVALGRVLHIESAYEAPVVPRFSGFHRGLPSSDSLFGPGTNTQTAAVSLQSEEKKGLISKVAWPCVFQKLCASVLVVCVFVCVLSFPSVADSRETFITRGCTYTHTHSGLSPAVTPHSRQMGDICSLEIFLHYCHRGTSLNVCFPAPVLMRTCLLKWWSTWQRTFTLRHAPTDHTCDSVLSSRAGRVMSARCTTFAAPNKVNWRLLRNSVVPDIVHSIHRADIYIG